MLLNKILSVIIPIYNGGDYIIKLIDSIRLQNPDIINDIEIILVNDGSNDNSEKICLELRKLYSNIIYLKKENGGIASARNFGLEFASGQFITFCDQDDVVIKGYSYFLELIGDADFLISNSSKKEDGKTFFNENVKMRESCDRSKIETLATYMLTYGALERKSDLQNPVKDFSSIWNCIFKREFIKENGIRFEQIIDYEDDWRFVTQSLVFAKKIVLTPECYYKWTVNQKSESHTHKYISNYFEKRQKHIEWIAGCLRIMNFSKDEILKYKNAPHIVCSGTIWGFYNACCLNYRGFKKEMKYIEDNRELISSASKKLQNVPFITNFFLILLCNRLESVAYFINKYIIKKYYH